MKVVHIYCTNGHGLHAFGLCTLAWSPLAARRRSKSCARTHLASPMLATRTDVYVREVRYTIQITIRCFAWLILFFLVLPSTNKLTLYMRRQFLPLCMAAKISALGLILSSSPYLRSVRKQFPFQRVFFHLSSKPQGLWAVPLLHFISSLLVSTSF